VGARHRGLASSVTGQSVSLSLLAGTILGVVLFVFGPYIVRIRALDGVAQVLALKYLQLLAISLPFSTLMFVGASCLRGGGDTLTPAMAMVVVDVVNIVTSFALCRGWFGLPEMGFVGIAIGTIIAYIAGGVIIFLALLRGREGGAVKLYLHRMRLHWHTMKRLLRVGLPSGTEGLISWAANFGVVIIINQADRTNAMAAAHINAIRIESLSFMTGFAVATAVATMVGQSLGAKQPERASRAAWLGYAVGGGAMTAMGVLFMLFSHPFARFLSDDPTIERLTAQCLQITGAIQGLFAMAAIFGGALRGAGDTLAMMLLWLASVVLVRFTGVMIVGLWLDMGLAAIWIVLAAELCTRGLLVLGRFLHGGWKRIEV
jgi:putative MATE family efflux protein